jgi:hypothetical protein
VWHILNLRYGIVLWRGGAVRVEFVEGGQSWFVALKPCVELAEVTTPFCMI